MTKPRGVILLMSSEPNDEVSDTRDDAQGTEAGNKKGIKF